MSPTNDDIQQEKHRLSQVTRRQALNASVALGVSTAALPNVAASESDGPQFEDGRALPVFGDDDIIREEAWVETERDTTNTGRLDRIHVEIARPESTTDDGIELPVIIEPSPYYGGFNFGMADLYDVDVPLYEPDKPGRDNDKASEQSTPEPAGHDEIAEFMGSAGTSIGPSAYEEHFLPRGFIFVYASSRGTHKSTGANTCGDAREVDGVKAVVDWLNGRATAYDAKTGGEPVEASWTTGKTGMIGASYNGTLPNGVAATGVDGLEAIVPEIAISSWYNYFRERGLVIAPIGWQGEDAYQLAAWVTTRENPEKAESILEEIEEQQDRETGDYNGFWDDRNYRNDTDQIEAAVLVAHGLNDENVKTRQFAAWYDELKNHDVPRKIWLHQGGHTGPLGIRTEEWLDELNQWWTRWLFDVDNDIMEGPRAEVEREDGSWTTYGEWPHPEAKSAELNFTPGGEAAGGLTVDHTHGQPVTETFFDPENPEMTVAELVGSDNSPYRLLYWTEPLEKDLHLSGTPTLSLRLSFETKSANLTGALVDFDESGGVDVVTRGWMNPQNRKSREETHAIQPGIPYRLEFDLQPDDHVFETGHQLGIAVLSTDYELTQRPPEEKELTLDVYQSSASLPVIGGEDAADEAVPNTFDGSGNQGRRNQ